MSPIQRRERRGQEQRRAQAGNRHGRADDASCLTVRSGRRVRKRTNENDLAKQSRLEALLVRSAQCSFPSSFCARSLITRASPDLRRTIDIDGRRISQADVTELYDVTVEKCYR